METSATIRKDQILIRPTRAAALRELGRSRAHQGYLGLAFSACRACDARRIGQRLERIARDARMMGTLTSGGARYEIWRSTRTNPLLPVRLLVAHQPGGSRELVAADHRPGDAPPPSYLAELNAWELEEELRGMRARLVWEPRPLSAAAIDGKYGGRRHIIYIPVDERGTLLKVGETADRMADRYPGNKILPGRPERAHAYWVATVEVQDSRPRHSDQWVPGQKHHVQDVEHLVARRLSRGGAPLPLHLIRKDPGGKIKPLTARGGVEIGSLLPTALNAAVADRPSEDHVAKARLRNNLSLAPGDRYELPAGMGSP
ncbi:MAG TPA: hypothetical protein VNO55_15725 [Polyangia bacterium]|nr:hypothetical protein [Polyangia bacterium]